MAAIARAVLYRAMLAGLCCFILLMGVAVVPGVFGYPTLSVDGGSMGDSLPRGSIAIARWVAPEEVQVGYVIVVDRAGSKPKLHRVVSIENDGNRVVAHTKGDANDATDPGEIVLRERVAVQTYAIPHLGYGANFARTPLGWTLLVLLPAFVLSLLTLRDIWADDTRLGGVSAAAA